MSVYEAADRSGYAIDSIVLRTVASCLPVALVTCFVFDADGGFCFVFVFDYVV